MHQSHSVLLARENRDGIVIMLRESLYFHFSAAGDCVGRKIYFGKTSNTFRVHLRRRCRHL